MDEVKVFKSIVEPSLERIPLLEIAHEEKINGANYTVSHLIHQNVLTDFDRKLSQHLAATRGCGFPAISVRVRFRAADGKDEWKDSGIGHYPSSLHAMRAIAIRALASDDKAVLHIHDGADRQSAKQREISRIDLDGFSSALDLARALGEVEFLEITGDFDMMLIRPGGGTGEPMVVDLVRGNVTVAGLRDSDGGALDAPLFDFSSGTLNEPAVRAYLATARQSLAAAKEAAVMAFRTSAEERIINVDRALSGRPLVDFRLEVVRSLVSRLKLGLGPYLDGLSEDAQITAFEWSASIERAETRTAPASAASAGEPRRRHVNIAYG